MIFQRFALAAIFLAAPAYAEWAPRVYTGEYDACVAACDKNNPTQHDKCTGVCGCVMGALQSQFPDHDKLSRETAEQQLPERVAEVKAVTDSCNKKFWGVPAPRELKFK